MNAGRKALLQGMRLYLTNTEILVHVDLAGARRVGKVVWVNDKTTWVQIRKGAKTFDVVKRHNHKHNVNFFKMYKLRREGLTRHEILRTTIKDRLPSEANLEL